jgi:hypothetical protein
MTNRNKRCRVGGQGLVEGQNYVIESFDFEVLGRDMISTFGTVVDDLGVAYDIKNLHIAFDFEDILKARGA